MTSTQENLTSPDIELKKPIIEIKSLKKYFEVESGFLNEIFGRDSEKVHAVDNIDLSIMQGEIFGLVGESGCGKTTTARVISGLETPTQGEFYWKGDEIKHSDLKPKPNDVKTQFVFQDPYASLNPRMKVGEATQHPLVVQKQISDNEIKNDLQKAWYSEILFFVCFIIAIGLYTYTFITTSALVSDIISLIAIFVFGVGLITYLYFGRYKKNQIIDEDVIKMFDSVGLNPPIQYYNKYPHELSGGERQRVNIARSIILNPELLILDEPTSMLDVSLRAGILNLLEEIKNKFDISILFITHDLATARHFCDRVAVMYVGEIVELGATDEMFRNPLHPYTKSLVDAIPSPRRTNKDRIIPKGDVADSINPPPACRFNPRCPFAEEKCRVEKPELRELKPNRWVACHFPLLDTEA